MITKKPFGLRCEIVVSSSLLVGAALLFVALLLLRLNETDLLEQSITLHSRDAQALSGLLAPATEKQFPHLLSEYAKITHLSDWRLSDSAGNLIAGDGATFGEGGIQTLLQVRQILLWQPVVMNLHYPPSWRWVIGDHDAKRYLDLSVAISKASGQRLILQLRYSLRGIYQRMLIAQKIALGCCLAYGLVLVFTAVFILNRAVVLPVIRLTESTRHISRGDLSQRVEPAGPKEINLLGVVFNRMAANLHSGAIQQQLQLEKLRHSNQQLQLAQHHLVQSERMASVGNLASGIAHELGNPLSAVIGYLELVKRKLIEDDTKGLVNRALHESERMDQLLKDMLDFASAGSDVDSGSCNPAEVIGQTCSMLDNQGALKGRHVSIDVEENLPTVAIAPHKLQQVLVNLLINARDATAEQGEITVQAMLGDDVEAAEAADWIELKVADNGHGIGFEQQQEIFDPFFTTKAPGKGRGLGLYVSYQLISACGGSINVESTPQQGCCFTIKLPQCFD